MGPKAEILVVDNDPDVVEQLTVLLGGEGYRVTAAYGKEEAEERLLSVKPDLAIIDLMMEQMDSGFALANRLGRLYPGTPVILLTAVTAVTGMSFRADSPQAQAWLGAGRVLDKPVRPEQLKAEVRRLLDQAGRAAAGPAAGGADAAGRRPGQAGGA